MQYAPRQNGRTFTPRPKVPVARRDYAPPIIKPNTDRELNLLVLTRDWHALRVDLKEDGKRHREMVRRINIVIEAYNG